MFPFFKKKSAEVGGLAAPQKQDIRRIAHDLRSPIAVIAGYVDFRTARGVLDPEEAAYLEAVRKSVEKLTRLTDEIKDGVVSTAGHRAVPHLTEQLAAHKPGARTILLVDDDDGIRFQWKTALSAKGINTIEAASGEELLAMKIDFSGLTAAIVDYQFERSDLNGLDVVEYLKRKKIERIYMCTANYQDEDLRCQAERLGVRSVLGKPIEPQKVVKDLDRSIS